MGNPAEITLSLTNTNQGTLSINTLRLVPSTAGVGTNPSVWKGKYFSGIPLSLTAEPKPGHRFVGWYQSTGRLATIHAADTAANYSSWTSGSGDGSGFGPWSIQATTANSGQAGSFLYVGGGGWGLYANSGQSAWAYRSLSNALTVGRTFAVRLRHGIVQSSGSVEIELGNQAGQPLFEFRRSGTNYTYEINGVPTDLPVTTASLDLEFTLLAGNTYEARVTPVGGSSVAVAGALQSQADSSIRRFSAFNQSAGSGSGADFFVTSLQVSTPSTSPGETFTFYSSLPATTATLGGDAVYQATFEAVPSD
jgi:hypothetical protein